MKAFRYITAAILVLIISVGLNSCAAKHRTSDEPLSEEIRQSIENRDFKISVRQMVPMMGRVQYLTSPYSLTLRNDSVFSYLPFFGRAYTVPFGGGQGLIFDGPLSDYNVRYSPKGSAKIAFRVRTLEDMYVFSLDIFSNGSSNIRVNSNNRQGISFYGEVESAISDQQ